MGRAPCCDKANVKRGPWSAEEDTILKSYLEQFGNGGNWISLPRKAGLKRCGKSCRLRWLNYLRPDIKHGGFTEEEDIIISHLYRSTGSRWSLIASKLPGRTDNDVKNYWNTKLKKKYLATGKVHNNENSNQGSASTYLSADSYYAGPHQGTILSPSQVNMSSSLVAAASSLSVSSSSTLDNNNNNYVLWSPNNEKLKDKGNLMDFSFESAFEFLNGFDFQEAISEIAPDLLGYFEIPSETDLAG